MSCSTCTTASLRAFLSSFALTDARSVYTSSQPRIITRPRHRLFHAPRPLHLRVTDSKLDDPWSPENYPPKSADDQFLPFDLTPASHIESPDATGNLPSTSSSGTWKSRINTVHATRTARERSAFHSEHEVEPEITTLDPSGEDFGRPEDLHSIEEIKAIFNTSRSGMTTKSHTAQSEQAPPKPRVHGLKSKASNVSGKFDIDGGEREQWRIQKSALAEKFGSSGWAPRKRLSPDALEGIRALHAQFPEKYTTPELAQQFQVSPEAVRRILRSKWKPNDEEESDRRRRWDKRGVAIWSQMVETGMKPPRKWRQMGVGKDHVPLHKRRGRSGAKGTEERKLEDSPAGAWSLSHSTTTKARPSAPLSERIL